MSSHRNMRERSDHVAAWHLLLFMNPYDSSGIKQYRDGRL